MTKISQEAREAEVTQADIDATQAILNTWFNRSVIEAILARHRQSAERGEVERYRHKKRGTVYEVVGNGVLQCAANPLLDEQPVVIYRGEDGKLWVRGIVEFHDGRFEALTTPPEAA